MIRHFTVFAAVAGTCAFSAQGAILSGTSGSRAASVEFTAVNTALTVRLTNTSGADALAPIDLLTGVFFEVSGSPVSFSTVSAMVAGGSSVLFGPDGGGNVGGEWAFRSGLVGAPSALTHGISSTGLGLFGPGDVFPGSNLEGPTSPGGLNYGILPAGDNPLTGNTPVTGTTPLIKNSVVFTLTCPNGFDASRITRAFFQYGTALDEGGFEVPAPGAAGLLGLGLIATGRRRR